MANRYTFHTTSLGELKKWLIAAENERLVREVLGKNRPALEGDKAKAAMDSSYELCEKLEADLEATIAAAPKE